jgi:hypothetical protein
MDRLRAEACRATAASHARVVSVAADLGASNDGQPPVNTGCQAAAARAVRQATKGTKIDAARVFRLLVLGHLVFAGSKLRTIRRQAVLEAIRDTPAVPDGGAEYIVPSTRATTEPASVPWPVPWACLLHVN